MKFCYIHSVPLTNYKAIYFIQQPLPATKMRATNSNINPQICHLFYKNPAREGNSSKQEKKNCWIISL